MPEKTLNAQRVYKILSEWNLNEKDLTNLEQEFRTDDHRYWESKKPDQKPNPMLSRKWGEINDGIETDLETFSQEAGERDGDFLEQIKTENRSRYDYREFLRKFAVFHEELAVDDDSFDSISIPMVCVSTETCRSPASWEKVSRSVSIPSLISPHLRLSMGFGF